MSTHAFPASSPTPPPPTQSPRQPESRQPDLWRGRQYRVEHRWPQTRTNARFGRYPPAPHQQSAARQIHPPQRAHLPDNDPAPVLRRLRLAPSQSSLRQHAAPSPRAVHSYCQMAHDQSQPALGQSRYEMPAGQSPPTCQGCGHETRRWHIKSSSARACRFHRQHDGQFSPPLRSLLPRNCKKIPDPARLARPAFWRQLPDRECGIDLTYAIIGQPVPAAPRPAADAHVQAY